MGLLAVTSALLTVGATVAPSSAAKHEAVVVQFDYGGKDWSQFLEFEEVLEAQIEKAGIGAYDGNNLAIDGSNGSMYMHGSSANAVLALVEHQLAAAPFLKNVVVMLRY